MRNRLFKLALGGLLTILLVSCAPQGGHSDDCGPVVPVPHATISLFNGQQPPAGTELSLVRTAGSTVVVTLEYAVIRQSDWCMRGYFGPLTLSTKNLPSGITGQFTPASLPASSPNSSQPCTLTLTIPASIPDGLIPLTVGAGETTISTPSYTLRLSTAP